MWPRRRRPTRRIDQIILLVWGLEHFLGIYLRNDLLCRISNSCRFSLCFHECEILTANADWPWRRGCVKMLWMWIGSQEFEQRMYLEIGSGRGGKRCDGRWSCWIGPGMIW